MTKHKILALAILLISSISLSAQVPFKTATDGSSFEDNDNEYDTSSNGNVRSSEGKTWGRDTTKHDKVIPYGIFQWKIDRRLGTVIPAENVDTATHLYSAWNNTDGMNGEYNYLGNLGSARLSRIYLNRVEQQAFFFLQPYSYGFRSLDDFLFTNTKSPYTNLAYHKAGGSETGQDRFRAHFAANFSKICGWGFNVDYLYGRGYYKSSQSAIFNSNIFGYYRGLEAGNRYDLHVWTQIAHHKTAENGGIEDDNYIHDPQSFPQSYGTNEIPTVLSETYNRNDFQTYYLTHRYYLGYEKERPEMDSIRNAIPVDSVLLNVLNDSIKQVLTTDSLQRFHRLDSLRTKWLTDHTLPTDFVPVASIVHTLKFDHLNHTHYGYDNTGDYYTDHYYGDLDDIKDRTTGIKIKNTVGLAMQEGFKPWVKMGITAFVSHQFEKYKLPETRNDTLIGEQSFKKNNFSVGGQIEKEQGKFLHYKAVGEFTLLGSDIGAFDIDGRADLNFPLFKKDTVQLAAHAFIRNERPDFYLEHYHSQSAWWDETLSMQKRMRVEGTLSNKRTKTSITVGFENVAKYTYLAMENTLLSGKNAESTNSLDYSHAVRVKQAGTNIQIFSAALKQNFRLGPLNWENEITYQATSDADKLPLPALNVYSNLYLKFPIFKVLHIELGGDIRYFTSYYAPDFSPALGQYAVQDSNNPRIKIGNYPIVNVYLNVHLKRCRMYVAVNHVNAGTGNMFLAPHYPIDPFSIHYGLSWNFFN